MPTDSAPPFSSMRVGRLAVSEKELRAMAECESWTQPLPGDEELVASASARFEALLDEIQGGGVLLDARLLRQLHRLLEHDLWRACDAHDRLAWAAAMAAAQEAVDRVAAAGPPR